jgi:rhodanese-related sulfurtransferase
MRLSTNRKLAGAAAGLAVLALLAGDGTTQSIDLDQVDAITLAEWIRDRRPGLRVIDLRTRADFEQFHIPTATRMAVDEIATTSFQPNETVVLYADGGIAAARAAVMLRARGLHQVQLLTGGLYEWLDLVMNPRFPAAPTADQQRTYARQRELSRYFGGQPSVFSEGSSPSTSRTIHKLRRRTC